VPPTWGSIPQIEAAILTRSETSLIDGREKRSVCQQSSSSFQTLSESPSSSAFAGFEGLSSPKTLKTASDPENSPNGSVPVRTYEVRINIYAYWHRAVQTWYITIPIAYMSAPFVGVHLSNPNLDGTRSSGAMKGVAPLPAMDTDDPIPRLGSHTTVANSKSVRHAVIGLAFVIRMLA
jgi:hypothetical protein